MQPVHHVFETLKKYGSDYLIIENSICYAPKKTKQCSLKELLDLDNGHANSGQRFCEELRLNIRKYKNLFTVMMENKSFRIYKIDK